MAGPSAYMLLSRYGMKTCLEILITSCIVEQHTHVYLEVCCSSWRLIQTCHRDFPKLSPLQ